MSKNHLSRSLSFFRTDVKFNSLALWFPEGLFGSLFLEEKRGEAREANRINFLNG